MQINSILSMHSALHKLPETYLGENIWIGKLGQFLTLAAFILALASLVLYTMAEVRRKQDDQASFWSKQGRIAFGLHALSVIGIFGLLLYMIVGQFYEYDYVYNHSSRSLPLKYVISAFWEGQEGSFLLWIFWHSILGLCLMRWTCKWEYPTMLVVSIAQVLLLSMVLGIHVGSTKIGINPFLLLREKYLHLRIKRKLPFPHYGWRRPECPASKLLDGDSSACAVFRICLNHYSLCLCARSDMAR